MENLYLNNDSEERVVPGILGAFLFSLAGGVIWFVLWQIGVIAGLSGAIGVICAIKGYSVFAKKESVKGIVIASVLALAVIVFAWYLCIGYDYYLDASSAGLNVSVLDCLFSGMDYLELADLVGMPEVRSSYLSNLAVGIIFTLLAGGGYVYRAIKASRESAPASVQYNLNGEDPKE